MLSYRVFIFVSTTIGRTTTAPIDTNPLSLNIIISYASASALRPSRLNGRQKKKKYYDINNTIVVVAYGRSARARLALKRVADAVRRCDDD